MENNRYILVCALVALLLSSPAQGITLDDAWCFTKTLGGSVLVGTGAIVAAPAVLGAVGFGAGGIAAGSVAAKLMAMSAASSGGGVLAGGAVATLQSVGAAGLGVAGKTVLGASVGGVYRYFAGGCSDNDFDCVKKKKEN